MATKSKPAEPEPPPPALRAVHHVDTYSAEGQWGWRAMSYTDEEIQSSGLQFESAEEAEAAAPQRGESL